MVGWLVGWMDGWMDGWVGGVAFRLGGVRMLLMITYSRTACAKPGTFRRAGSFRDPRGGCSTSAARCALPARYHQGPARDPAAIRTHHHQKSTNQHNIIIANASPSSSTTFHAIRSEMWVLMMMRGQQRQVVHWSEPGSSTGGPDGWKHATLIQTKPAVPCCARH